MSMPAIIGVVDHDAVDDDDNEVMKIYYNTVYHDGYEEKLGAVLKAKYTDYYDVLDLVSKSSNGYSSISKTGPVPMTRGSKRQHEEITKNPKSDFEEIVKKSSAGIGYLFDDNKWMIYNGKTFTTL